VSILSPTLRPYLETAMDKWTVYVEINGRITWKATYSDLASAQMAQEAKRLHYFYHRNVVVGIEQS
jgi:hypothetical protein